MALFFLKEGETDQEYYRRLDLALRTAAAISSDTLFKFLDKSGGENGSFLPMPRVKTKLLGIVLSQQGSDGELLRFVTESLGRRLFGDLVNVATLDDFMVQECVQLRPSAERIKDFEMRIKIIANLNPNLLHTIETATKSLIRDFKKAAKGEEVEVYGSFKPHLQSTEIVKSKLSPSVYAQYNAVLAENLLILRKVFKETPKTKPTLKCVEAWRRGSRII